MAVIIAIFVAFGTASLGFPQHMATLFEKMGAYSFATGYAGLAYTYKGTVENLARCVDDSIFAHDDANIVNYGNKLVEREDFDAYCEQRNEALDGAVDYYQYIYGNLACAIYSRGDKDGALDAAKNAMQKVSGFPANNALAALAIRSAKNSDTEFSATLYNLIKDIEPTLDQQNYYDVVISILI